MRERKIHLRCVSLVILLLTILVVSNGLFGDTITLATSADTFAHHSYPNNAANTATRLGVGYREEATLPYREGWIYLKFSLTSLPDDVVVTSAVLYLMENGNLPNNSLTVSTYAVTDDSWSASTLTWNNKPDTAATSTSDTVISTTANLQWYSWNITSLVSTNNAEADDILSVCLKENPEQTTTDTWAMFVSTRDSNTSYYPYLVITYTNVPEPVTISLLGIGGIGLLFSKRSSHI